MNCEARQDSLIELALGTLSGPELQELRAHLANGCPACEGRLAEFQTTLGMIPLGQTSVRPGAGARDRLMARIAVTDNSIKPNQPFSSLKLVQTSTFLRSTWWIPAMIGAAVAACLTILVYSNILATEHKNLQAVQNQLANKEMEIQQTQQQSKDARDMLRLIDAPSVKVVFLDAQPTQPKGTARLIWDPVSHTFCLCVWNVNQLPVGKGYELWMFANGKPAPIPAGTMMVDAKGTGMIQLTLPSDPGSLDQVAISDEPFNAGKGMPHPTGNIQFARKWN